MDIISPVSRLERDISMSESASSTIRDAAGRFVPGQSGNPAGKVPGTRNHATRLRALMAEGEEAEIGRIVIDKAKAGDAVAARFVVGHLYPRPRARTVALELADGLPATNVVAAHDAVLEAMFAGEIAPDEAEAMTRVLDARTRALDAWRKERHERVWNRGFPAMRPAKAPMPPLDENEPEPSPACGRGQGECVRYNADSAEPSRHPHPDPPERLSKGPEGEGESPDSLHSACIAQADWLPTASNLPPELRPIERELLLALGDLGRALERRKAGGDRAGRPDRT